MRPLDKRYGSWEDERHWVVKCMVCGGPIKKGWGWLRPENDGIECCTCAGCANHSKQCEGCAYIKEQKEAAENGTLEP